LAQGAWATFFSGPSAVWLAMFGSVALAFLTLASASPISDLQRARTKVPRDEYRGHDFAEMGEVLSKQLRASLPATSVRSCDDFSARDLHRLQASLAEVAEPALLAIYNGSHDNRRERHASMADLRDHWRSLLTEASADDELVLRDALCHDVVMRFVHHTTAQTRQGLTIDPKFVLPTLPTHRHVHNGEASSARFHKEYVAASGCQACHSRLIPLPEPSPAADCETKLTAACSKRGQLGKDACTACVANHTSDLSSCSAAVSAAWCDHPPACIGKDECPIWPKEFASPFTLHATVPHIDGAKSNFYYKYTADVQVQTVDYYEKCFPFVNARTAFNNLPCKLFFQPTGIYLSQPGRVDCCKFVDKVGAVPPEFLQSYTYKGSEKAPDMYGNSVQCDKWEGPSGFKYWTVGHDDAKYKNFGHDIVFQDGPTGVTWRWGNFKVEPQADSLFELPAGKCEESCPKYLGAEDAEGLMQDLHVRRAMLHHEQRQPAFNGIVV